MIGMSLLFLFNPLYTNRNSNPIIQRKDISIVKFVFVCLIDLILYAPSTVSQLYRDGSSWVEPVLSSDKFMCLAQGPQRSDACEARTRGPLVSSQELYH